MNIFPVPIETINQFQMFLFIKGYFLFSHSCLDRYLNMGNLLKVLTCTDLEQESNFFLDFENAQPIESEKEIYNQVNVVLKDAEGIFEDLQSYRGAGHEIREAIQHPADEKLQEKAWGAVVPLVGKLKKFYEFSQRLEAALRGLLGASTSTPYSPTQHLEREQDLDKQFAEILHFTLRFDELKVGFCWPALCEIVSPSVSQVERLEALLKCVWVVSAGPSQTWNTGFRNYSRSFPVCTAVPAVQSSEIKTSLKQQY